MPAMADTSFHIGPYQIAPRVILAPMAGVTDKPFRVLSKRLGAGLCVSEMTTSDPRFWNTAKSRHRMDHDGEPAPISVQIAGTVPEVMAEAARYNVDHGAQIIDINMGCPAKKVCNAWAGSALMRDEALVARILEAARQRHRVALLQAPASAHLERDRHAVRRRRPHHGFDDFKGQRLVAHQRRASPLVADLLGRAAHVDVDDLGAVLDVEPRRPRHRFRVGAGDLHGDRPGLAGVVAPQTGLVGMPERGVRRGHLGHDQPGALCTAQ